MATPGQIRSRHTARRELSALRAVPARSAGWPHWALVVTSIVTLLVATSSAVMTWRTTQYGASVGLQKESRDKRSQLYAAYLTAAREWAATADAEVVRTHAVLFAEKALQNLGPRPESGPAQAKYDTVAANYNSVIEGQGSATQAHRQAEVEFDKQADQLFVYGSEDAWRTNMTIAGIFFRYDDGIDSREDLANQPKLADDKELQAALTGFQVIFCREVSPEPRAGCK